MAAAGQGQPSPKWELKVIKTGRGSRERKPSEKVRPAGVQASSTHPFAKYASMCTAEVDIVVQGKEAGTAAGTMWTPDEIRKLYETGKTTHIIELYDTDTNTMKGFAFLHAPEEHPPEAHAKCVLACGVPGKEWNADGKSAMQIIHPKREEIARDMGYKILDLSAGNRDPLVKVWEKYGFTELPGQEGKVKDIEMTKTLPVGGRRKTRKTAKKKPRKGGRRTRRR